MKFFDSFPTYLNKAGEWILDWGVGFQEKIGATGETIPGRISGIGTKAKETLLTKVAEMPITQKVAGVPGPLSEVKARERELLITQERANIERRLIAEGETPEMAFKKSQAALTLTQQEEITMSVLGFMQPVRGVGGKGFDWRKRGFIKSVEAELPELKVAGQYVPRSTDRLAIKARNLIKNNLPLAEKMANRGTDDDAVAVGAELLKHYSDAAAKASGAVRNVLYEKASNLANVMAHNLTEQGRSVQAASILSRLTPEGQLKFAAREIQRYNEVVEARKGGLFGLMKKIPELTKKHVAGISSEMKAIQGMPEGVEKAMRFQKLQNRISDLVPTPLMKKVIAVWKAGLLTGIKTTGLNVFANISHFGTEVTKNIPATMVDKVVKLFTGKRAVAFTLRGIGTGAVEGTRKGWRYLRTGFDERNIGVKLDYRRINFGTGKLARGLQKYTDTVFRILGTEDQPFYYATKLQSLFEQAKVAAINKGLRGREAQKFIDSLMQNPTDDMLRYAAIDAETAVFQQRTALGEAARAVQKIGGGAGEIIVPFGRTPSAVAMQIVNYSPVGIVKTIIENAGRGRFDQRLFSQGIGRGITGTAALAIGVELYKKGLITLARPSGEKERKLWELEGRQANSVKVDGKWRQIQVLGPAGNLLLIGGQFQQAFDESGSPSEAMAKALAGASLSFTQQTFLTGVSNFIEAITDPARSAERVAGSTLASTIPTISADIARATDVKERRANEIFEKFMVRIPGLRETLEPQVTVLGVEKETIGNPLEIMADPTRPSPEQITPVVSELRRLWDAGFRVSPTLLGDKKGFSSLTPEQNTELWKRAGEITNAKLSSLISKEAYWGMVDDEKAKYVEKVVDKSKLYARVEKVLQLTEGLQGQELLSKLKEFKTTGLMTREVFTEFQKLR